jgi:NAD(P)H-hydrate epimerase
MRVLNTAQMREADRRTIEDLGIPALVLMENAGRQVVAAIEARFEAFEALRVSVLCGPGNNGGDGFVAARVLAERGLDVGVFLLGQAADVKGDARTMLTILRNLGQDVVEIRDASTWELHGSDVLGADLIIDALFGTGLRGGLSGLAETIIADVNAAPRPVVAIDLPSGVSADGPDLPGPVIDAVMTVALGAPKLPLLLPPAERLAGTLVVADIGIPDAIIDAVEGPRIRVLTREDMRALIQPRSQDSHKGDYGRVLVVAGSRGKSGAAHLAAMGALRSGAGLVTVAAPASVAAIVATLGAEYMTLPLEESADGTVTPESVDAILSAHADVIAVGPGLGQSAAAGAFVRALVERTGVPLVLDADALNAFAGRATDLVARDGVDIIITPHPGEMGRLVGLGVDEVQAHRLDIAREFAQSHRVHVILKGHRTIVASPDGALALNLTGNPGMATGGTGDVLLGAVAGWFGQLLDAESAAHLAVYLHGLAGDLAEADEGECALIAGDVVSRLGDAVLDLTARRRKAPAADEPWKR